MLAKPLVPKSREKRQETVPAKIRRRPSENSPPFPSPSARLKTAENPRSESSTEHPPPNFNTAFRTKNTPPEKYYCRRARTKCSISD